MLKITYRTTPSWFPENDEDIVKATFAEIPGWGGDVYSEADLIQISSAFASLHQACNFKNNYAILDKPSSEERRKNEMIMELADRATDFVWEDFEGMKEIRESHE